MKRFLLSALWLLAAALSAPAQQWAHAKLDKSPRHPEWVMLKHGGREVNCFVVYPEVKDKAPAIVLIHEIFGLTDWVRSAADELAAEGYIVIAPDLLWGSVTNGGTEELIKSRSNVGKAIQALPAEQITADLDAAVDYAAKLDSCNGKVVVAGFCWGGGQSFRFATSNKAIKAAFVFYGTPPPADSLSKINCPVYGFYAGNDARITATVPKTTDQMKAAGKAYEPVVYDGAGHGFMRAGEDPTNTNPDNTKARNEAFKRWLELMKKI
ncbi:MAG TPA: dienelactone hydrolase family protein [Verrucomicrobiae bacterium]|nr:dienelactone hydrolase family protein [Verrucomicrobiae bacterium]